jgi:transcriptional regulator with XRE-family HTH domain
VYRKYIANDPDAIANLEFERMIARIARQIYDLRKGAGLTQAQLATRVGTSASVICQLEDADYRGRSLQLLQRVAAALNRTVEVTLVPVRARTSGGRSRSHKAQTSQGGTPPLNT